MVQNIYIYMCVCVCVCVCVQHFFINAYFIEQYRHLLSTHFYICHFQLPHWFYGIWRELVDETPITNFYLSTFCLILGHHQGCVHCKSDVTFVCTLLLCKCLLFIPVCCIDYSFLLIAAAAKDIKYISTGFQIDSIEFGLFHSIVAYTFL